MAAGSYFIWISLLLSCVLQASDNRHVRQVVNTVAGQDGVSGIESIISGIPINLPEGIDPKNINITSITVNTCTGMKEQLALLKMQLQQTTLRTSQLDNEAFGLRREVRQLKLQLAACSSTASSITGSYQTHLQNKLKQLLGTFDSDTFLILKTVALYREEKSLQWKVKLAANSTENTHQSREVQRELQEKTTELNAMKQQINRSQAKSALILEIISLQSQIWDLEQAKLRRGQSSSQPDRIILTLQNQLDEKITELQDKRNPVSVLLKLISVHSKITMMERLISVHIEESRTNTADNQRQWRQRVELLKKKVLQLSRDEHNKELTKEIMKLQAEVEHYKQLMTNTKKTSDSQLRELRVILEGEKEQQENVQKQLEGADYAEAQLIMKIISIMKEVRELPDDEHEQTTSTSQATTLQTLLQAKEREYAKAQAEINELQRKLRLKSQECFGLEERHEQVKTEYEQKIAELNRTGDSEVALILNVINLQNELKTLKELISTTDDADRISELQGQLEDKQEELNSKTADIERLVANPKRILTIVKLQNEIWDLQKKTANETTIGHVKDLQNRVDDLITEINDKANGNTKLMLKIITLQNQVGQLQRELTNLQNLQTTQEARLRNDLTTKREELQHYVNELNEKNQTNGRLILRVTNLQNQLRNLENERHNDNTTSYSTIAQLRRQLKVKMGEQSRDQALIKVLQNQLQAKGREHAAVVAKVSELQRKLQLKSQECSGLEERHEQVKAEFEQKIAELNRTGDSNAALIVDVMNLHDELNGLRERIATSDDPQTISELQRQLKKKQEDLNSKTADIERLISNPKIVLTIIELQDEIWDLQKKAANETTSASVKELQSRLDGLIAQIDDKGNENTKLVLKIITLQRQVEQLQIELMHLQKLQTTQEAQLRNDLITKKNELQKYVNELNEKNRTNARLILEVTTLQNQLKNLEKEKQKDGQTTSATITKLREQLKAKVEQGTHDRAEIEALRDKLNQTDAQCSSFEERIKDLQNDLDAKMTELQSKSDTITSLALQVSTLTLQIEELKTQLQNTQSETKIKELQTIIDKKTNELAKKTEELKERSAQPQRFLQIIAIQTQIEKLANVAANETDYIKIRALEDHLKDLIDGIKDEKDENTKLMFKILAQQDEIARLKRQEERQTKAELERITELENELEGVRNQIKEKMLVLDSSEMRITNLSAQIMELNKKIKPLEDEIEYLKEDSAENLKELQKRLDLSKMQLEDSELQLKDADAKNFKSLMEIADLRTKLKKAQREASKAAKQNINELEQQIETQRRETKKLENKNKGLKQEVEELKMCCSEANTQCDDLQTQLQRSQEDADRLQQQLREKDAKLKDLEEQTKEINSLEHEKSNLVRQLQQTQDNADYLKQQLLEKDANLSQMQQDLEEQTKENNKLQDDYNNLQAEKDKLERDVQELQGKLTDVEDKTIYPSRMTFDPNTANPGIELSADNTEMSIRSGIHNVPDHPGRFDVVLAALGKTGFSTGRHYWEVSVAGKLCFHIGMASESAPRRGTMGISPENGFWTIVLNKMGQYRAIDRRPVAIPVQIQPLTLGILLDYKKGQISFYDAGARTHMYSFRGQTFTDKIYPFINLCVEDVEGHTPIVLLTPGSVDWIV